MKSTLIVILVVINIACCGMAAPQGMPRTDSLNRVLSALNDPNKKVDLILEFLEKPENQFLEASTDYALRAYEIALQTNYAPGRIRSMIKLGHAYFRSSDYKKAMEFAQRSMELAEDLNYDKELANALSLVGTIYAELGDYDYSSENFFKSLKIYEKLKDEEGISHSLGDIGKVFYSQQDYKKALVYFDKALLIAQKNGNLAEIKRQYNNIAVVYGDRQKYDTAIVFLRKALAISVKLGDKLGQGINTMNIGFDLMNTGNSDEALINFHQALELFLGLNNRIQIAKCYINIGYCYFNDKNIPESTVYFRKALEEGQKNGYYIVIKSASNILRQIYIDKRDSLNAFKYLALEKLADDSLFAFQKQKLISKLELQYIYEEKEFQRKLAQQSRNNFMLIIIFALISGVVILVLMLSRYRLKSKFMVLEKEKIESELNVKNRELTVNLLALIKKNEMLSDISNKLVQLEQNAKGSETKDTIAQISQDLRNRTDDKMLNEFSMRFQEVHAGFYEKLLATYPDLTPNELKLCAFLRLNMSTKDISELTGQQLASIDHARYRLRKKLNISNSEINLVAFLSQI